MKNFIFVSLSLIPLSLSAQVTLQPELLEAVKMMAVSEENIPGVMNLNYSLDPKDPACEAEVKEATTYNQRFMLTPQIPDTEKKWKFSLRTTLSGPKDKLEKHMVNSNSPEINSKLNNLIEADFDNYDDRLKAVGEACQGMNDFDKIRMSSMLARRLSSIYDYSRANGGSSAAVSSEDQWKALKSGQASGVCRDASLTVSQFLLACGFKKEQVAIKSYRTQDSGHQVTSIRTAEGEYTINWGELYNMESNDFSSPEPNIPNTGMIYSLYDPETGKIIEQKRTELAQAMKILAGGEVKDPTYTPNMIVAEAAYGGLAAKVFQTETNQGDKAKGGALNYRSFEGDARSFVDLSAGVAFAMNERDILVNDTTTNTLDQKIFYMQIDSKIQKAIPVFEGNSGKLSVAPMLSGSLDMAIGMNEYKDKRSTTMSNMNEVAGGAKVYYDTNNVTAYVGAQSIMSLTPKLYNNEAGEASAGIYVQRYKVEGGVSWQNDRLVASANTNMIISTLEKQQTYGVGVTDKKYATSCEAVYSVYDRSYGTREDYIVSRCSKSVSVQRLGSFTIDGGFRKSLDSDRRDTAIYVGTTLKFK